MLMLVVLVMHVPMGVLHRCMLMRVLVVFCDMKPDAKAHQ